jgi:hypothetical protein
LHSASWFVYLRKLTYRWYVPTTVLQKETLHLVKDVFWRHDRFYTCNKTERLQICVMQWINVVIIICFTRVTLCAGQRVTHSLVPHSLLWLTSWPESDSLSRSAFSPVINILAWEWPTLSFHILSSDYCAGQRVSDPLKSFSPGTYREPTVIPNIQTFRFTLQHFPFHVSCSKYSCLLYWIYWMFSWYGLQSFLSTFVTIPIAPVITGIIKHFMFHIRCISSHKLVQFLLFCFHFRSVSVCSYSHIYQDACFVFVFLLLLLFSYYYHYYR